jgi:hypothetical protein
LVRRALSEIAVNHLDALLKLLGTGAPRLDKGLKAKSIELVRLLDH